MTASKNIRAGIDLKNQPAQCLPRGTLALWGRQFLIVQDWHAHFRIFNIIIPCLLNDKNAIITFQPPSRGQYSSAFSGE
jgi:hypothetical protein